MKYFKSYKSFSEFSKIFEQEVQGPEEFEIKGRKGYLPYSKKLAQKDDWKDYGKWVQNVKKAVDNPEDFKKIISYLEEYSKSGKQGSAEVASYISKAKANTNRGATEEERLKWLIWGDPNSPDGSYTFKGKQKKGLGVDGKIGPFHAILRNAIVVVTKIDPTTGSQALITQTEPQGTQGESQGNQGGQQGDQGGQQGDQGGPQGNQGSQGEQGGSQGNQGSQGEQGGSQGNQGGSQGTQGGSSSVDKNKENFERSNLDQSRKSSDPEKGERRTLSNEKGQEELLKQGKYPGKRAAEAIKNKPTAKETLLSFMNEDYSILEQREPRKLRVVLVDKDKKEVSGTFTGKNYKVKLSGVPNNFFVYCFYYKEGDDKLYLVNPWDDADNQSFSGDVYLPLGSRKFVTFPEKGKYLFKAITSPRKAVIEFSNASQPPTITAEQIDEFKKNVSVFGTYKGEYTVEELPKDGVKDDAVADSELGGIKLGGDGAIDKFVFTTRKRDELPTGTGLDFGKKYKAKVTLKEESFCYVFKKSKDISDYEVLYPKDDSDNQKLKGEVYFPGKNESFEITEEDCDGNIIVTCIATTEKINLNSQRRGDKEIIDSKAWKDFTTKIGEKYHAKEIKAQALKEPDRGGEVSENLLKLKGDKIKDLKLVYEDGKEVGNKVFCESDFKIKGSFDENLYYYVISIEPTDPANKFIYFGSDKDKKGNPLKEKNWISFPGYQKGTKGSATLKIFGCTSNLASSIKFDDKRAMTPTDLKSFLDALTKEKETGGVFYSRRIDLEILPKPEPEKKK